MNVAPPPLVDGFRVSYTSRDAILYALSIGFGSTGSDYNHDLCYLYEEHPDFQVVPMFGLTLVFWARSCATTKATMLPSFPPPMMKAMQVIPKQYLRGDVSLEDFPVIHTFQSITWHRPLPVPRGSCAVDLKGSTCSIRPKSIGTFVTSEVTVSHEKTPICTLRSTVLVLGVSSDHVVPYNKQEEALKTRQQNKNDFGFWFQSEPFPIAPNQALLYRLASGDTNQIHVDASSLPLLESDQPLLHGLCTLGLAGRVILQHLHCRPVVLQLEGAFVKPVFVNDTVSVKVWRKEFNEELHFSFQVYNESRKEVAVDRGYMAVSKGTPSEIVQSRL